MEPPEPPTNGVPHHNGLAGSGELPNGEKPEDDTTSPVVNGSDGTASDEGETDSEEDSGDDDDDEEEEDADDDDDDEPALKYERIGGSLPDLLKKDSASALCISKSLLAMGTHGGIVHILDLTGNRMKSYKPHMASVIDIAMDETAEYVATASIDGQVVIHSQSESYAFDLKRPMRTVALEPNFAKRTSRAFVCGGMAGNLILHEKGWLGHKETVLHQGEGPIWQIRWRGNLIAWANDFGVKIYDTASQTRITFIDRPPDSPRADLFKCTLHWQDDATLLIAWADHIKVARIRARPRTNTSAASANLPPLLVEITLVLKCPHPTTALAPALSSAPPLTCFLILAYTPPDTSFLDEMTEDRGKQARKPAERPELRIISPAGAELAADAISLTNFQSWGCNDYVLAAVGGPGRRAVLQALLEVEKLEADGRSDGEDAVSAAEIGQRYIQHLVNDGEFVKAARLTPKVCGHDAKRWEDWIFRFQQQKQLQAIIPYVPTDSPQLDHLVYEMILAHFLSHDRKSLLQTVKDWPKEIYDISAVIVAVHAELDRNAASDLVVLMECLAELQGKALTYFLRLRRPNVFDLIRDNNLFTDVQDQALLLVEFDHELMEKRKLEGRPTEKSQAIILLVDHIHSIPVGRVVQQLQSRPYFLFLYLDALMDREPHMASAFADVQVKLYAEFATPRLIDFLRASNDYNLEKAYKMVFLLGRMGNNKQALTLIIEKLGDVHRAIDFAKEQNDDDLWEDLLKYSETRPTFIRGLLENVGAEISPLRLIRRIKNGLEIPGLKEALIKILQDFHLQISLLDGCQAILNGDSADFARTLHRDQTAGFFVTAKTACPICARSLQETPQGLVVLFLCRHVVHAACTRGGERLPQFEPGADHGLSGKIAFESVVRARLDQGCPVCHQESEGSRT
ncbi:hypothetical protein DFH09DRAFT_1191159 [Mycena vulgaris]|nr:hypothetical protein DFH09DRAFT_1191159 [Mycena vulgaris]